ncbi:glycosyltransferase [Alicyclobacillus mengziensis]|uniref:Glycosyltransferase n=1 Tax=Alicyclobacillus mengziensis TaxID=2931921 RepID=A0A9X7VYQ3_9BACL|nr:glycosyltransferase [Alicyclobacillus mengziensis]QSO47546.1 glycosyltransferase [Alicyclobacillus mengziensis]
MKTNDDIIQNLKQKQFDSARYACIERLKANPLDIQAWTFLGQAMVGLRRGRMAELCFRRALLFNPYAPWESDALRDAHAVSQGREDRQVLGLLQVPHVPVSACVLTRDNEHTIAKCLSALQGAVDEIIVVDTGSTDNTVSIVQSFGVSVHSLLWQDDFSKARNYALSLAHHDWIFSVDSDEILYPDDRDLVRTAAALFEDGVALIFALQMNQNGESLSPYPVPRLFSRRYFEWKRPIHEAPEVLASAGVQTPTGLPLRIRLMHSGYDPAKVNLPGKMERNIALLKRAIHEDASDFTSLYYLGRELSINHRYTEAIPHLMNAYQLGRGVADAPLLPLIGSQLAYCYTLTNHVDEALDVLKRVTTDCPEHPDAWFSYGVLLSSTKDNADEARASILRAKELATQYSGTLPFDLEIAKWKADQALRQL